MTRKFFVHILAAACLAGMSAGCKSPTGEKAAADPTTLDKVMFELDESLRKHEEEDSASVLMMNDEIEQALMSFNDSFEKEEEERFDIQVTDVDAKTFFLALVEDSPFNMTVHPGITGQISLNLNNVTIDEVLLSVRNVYGFEFIKNNIGYEVVPPTLQTKMYPLEYLNLVRTGGSSLEVSAGGLTNTANTGKSSTLSTVSEQNLWREIEAMVRSIVGNDPSRNVAVSPQSGIIVIRAMPNELREVEDFLERSIGSLKRQVILEAKVLEVTLDDGYQQGINWGLIAGKHKLNQLGGGSTLGGTGTNVTTQVSNIAGNLGDIGVDTLSEVSDGGIKAFGGMLAFSLYRNGFNAFIELLNEQGNVQVLSSPRVSTMNNQKAIIKIGTDEYYVTDVGSNTSTSSGTVSTTADVTLKPFFSGIALDVTPFIDADDKVTLHVHPSITTVSESSKTVVLDGKNQTYPLAKSVLRESDSVIRANSGQIVVIGGLMKHETSEVNTSLPILGDIPYLGNAFRQTKQIKHKKELVILLKPTVVKNEDWHEVIQTVRDDFSGVDRGFHYGGRPELFGHEAEGQRVP